MAPQSQALPGGHSYFHTVRDTPLVPVRIDGVGSPIWCKLEFLNPSGSTKDRIARHILEGAWRRGHIAEGSTVAEASSGSTSIAFALACSQLGLRFVAFIPAAATSEREWIIRATGGEVRRCDGGMSEVLSIARATCETEGWFFGGQFENEANTAAYRIHTGPEILRQIDGGCVDAVVSGVGTGGTLRGLYEAFVDAGCQVVAHAAIPREGGIMSSDPECCSLKFSGDVPGVADGLSRLYREWDCPDLKKWQIPDDECLSLTKQLWSMGFPVGPSSGLNLAGALRVARQSRPGARVVTVFPDRMERYFSHKVFEDIRQT